jgi:hypothetical protein
LIPPVENNIQSTNSTPPSVILTNTTLKTEEESSKPIEKTPPPIKEDLKSTDLVQYKQITHADLTLQIPSDIMQTAIKNKDSSLTFQQVCRIYLLKEKDENHYAGQLKQQQKTLITSKINFETSTKRMLLDMKEKAKSFSSVQNTDAIIQSLEKFFDQISKSFFSDLIEERGSITINSSKLKLEVRFGRSEEEGTCNILFQTEKGSILIWAPYPYKLKLK